MTNDAAATVDDGLGDIEAADGPWSLDAAPTDQYFLDFGPLRLPAYAGLRVQAELDAKTRRMGAVSVRVADCQVQIQVVATARGRSAWTDMRRAMTDRYKRRPGFQQAVEGRFGPELIATVTGREASGLLRDVTIRHVGIDGERWLLRAKATGPSVVLDETVARVDAFLSRCAVERGDAPLPAGTVMELKTPPGSPAAAAPVSDLEAP